MLNIMKILEKIKQNRIEREKEIFKILNQKKDYILRFNKDKTLLEVYDDKDKKIIASKYNFYGIYQPSTKLWIWASSIPEIKKDTIKFINKLKLYDHLFESDSDTKSDFYYQLLNQDTILLKDKEKISWINDLLIYLSNDIYYFNPSNSEGNIQFIGLSKIMEKYI
jgi:hypothetical protein